MEVDIREYFRAGLIAQKRNNFSYKELFCPFCERELTIVEAIHIENHLEHYKGLYICFNPECGAYDYEARKAYVKIYYSSQEAYNTLDMHRINVKGVPIKR
jgi:hypothetical protein